jgi:hypothetical protein
VTNDRQATDPDLHNYVHPAVRGADIHLLCGVCACCLLFGGVMTAKELLAKYLAGERSFIGEYLLNSNLRYSNLSGSDLSGSNLRGSDLSGSDLSGSNLTNATLPHFQIVPEKGEYTAFKKLQDDLICELLIPATAKRTSSLIGRKCRASRAKVISITSIDGKTSHKVGLSQHDGTEYKVGKFVKCKEKFDDDIRIECASGIHHFNNRKEAEEY